MELQRKIANICNLSEVPIQSEYKETEDKRKCLNCGNEFIRRKSRGRKREHCCKKCSFDYWYNKNKEYKIMKTIKNLKKNNYAYEKTKGQMNIRRIKAKTRYWYPIKNNICQICFIKPAKHRHHTTIPIEFDKFIFVCKECHTKIHQLNVREITTK